MNRRTTQCLLLTATTVLLACGEDDLGMGDTSNANGGDTHGAHDSGSDPMLGDATGAATSTPTGTGSPSDTEDASAECRDELIRDLGLVGGAINPGAVVDTPDGRGFASAVDATSGGIVEAPNNPWIYLRFTPDGLEKLEIDDLQALDSTDWDIAAKRFGLRLNGGVSGPSTVAAAALAGMTYEELTALPADAELFEEAFYDGDCTLVDDGGGQGAPGYVLTPWWAYPGCVATTYVPFVLALADGSHVKLVVDAYYETGQQQCNEAGMMGMGAANFSWRWAYLD